MAFTLNLNSFFLFMLEYIISSTSLALLLGLSQGLLATFWSEKVLAIPFANPIRQGFIVS